MKHSKLEALFALLVALLFLIPPATAMNTTSWPDEELPEHEAEITQLEDVMPDAGETEVDETEVTDPVEDLYENSVLAPYGKQITHPDKPVTSHGPDDSMETKSSVMVISKIGLHDENGDPVESLDDGEDGKVSAEITNEGGKNDVMTDVEIDFYYIDKDEDVYYIDSYNIELIEGDGNSSTAIVDWTADMLAREIKVVADPDGSDGGPSEGYQEVDIGQADYAQKLYCPYPAGSGSAGDNLDYYVKVDNIGKKSDDVKLEVVGAGSWPIKFDNGQGSKTVYNIGSGEHTWQKVTVTVPATANGDAYKDFSIKTTSQHDTDKTRSIDLRATVLRSTRPILLLDRDRGSAEYGTWCDTTKYWAAALDDAGYEGMYTRTTGSITNAQNYDVIMMPTGYDWTSGLQSNDETALINFVKDGGSLWIGGSMFLQASNEPSYGKTNVHPLFYYYMNVTWNAQERRTPHPMIGVAGDPIGNGKFYGMNYIYTEAQDWSEAVWAYANDTWSAGTFNLGDQYIGTRHHWQGSTPDKPEEYRTIYTGFDLAQVGDTFEKDVNNHYGHPDRTDIMYNSATWLGVAPPLPEANDLGIYEIVDPAGRYVYPGDNMDINVKVANYGIKDFESSYTVTVDIEAVAGGTYTKTLTKNVDASDNPIPARGWAYPGTTTTALSWTVPNNEGVKYKFTAKVGSDDNNDNNENFTYATAQKYEDIAANGAVWEWRLHYWLVGIKDTPIGIDVEVENLGARSATFDTWVNIMDPYEQGNLAEFTKEVTVGSGHVRTVHFLWTPDKAAGCRDLTQSWNYNYIDDSPPYWMDVGVDVSDDDMDNNRIDHYDGGNGNYIGDICVADWDEGGEKGTHGWTIQEPWHWTPAWVFGGEFGVYHGNNSETLNGTMHYDNDQKAIMTSPVLDWTQYDNIVEEHIYRYALENNRDYVSYQIKYADQDDTWRDAPASYGSNYSDQNHDGGSYLNHGNDWPAYAGHLVQIRWCFSSDAQNYFRGCTFDVLMIMANAENYYDRDLIIDDIAVDPLVGDVEEERSIHVTVKNIGEVVPDSDFSVYCNVTDDEGNSQGAYMSPGSKQTVNADPDFKKGVTKVIEWSWFPEKYGIYNVECSVEWTDDEYPENNMLETVGLVQFHFFFDDMEEGNPKKPEYDPWITGTEDTNGKGGDRATDDWEEGVPVNGPGAAYSGDVCWGTSLTAYYSNNSKDSEYLSVHIDLSTAKDPYLIFAHWLEIEAQGYDSAYVEIQEVGDEKWSVLWHNPEPEKEHYKTHGWETVNISLEDWQLMDINLRFRLMSDSDVSYAGWYVDDVGISGITPPDYDARITNIEVTPFYGGNIPPGESITIESTIKNVGKMNSGGAHKIRVDGTVSKMTGGNPTWLADLDEQEIQIDSGRSAVVEFDYTLPLSDGVEYLIEIHVEYEGEDEQFEGDNDMEISLFGRKLHDAGITRLYATPPLEDAGYPRVVTAVVTSHSNIAEEFSIDFEVRYQGETQKIAMGNTPVSLEVGETKEVKWNWTAYTYGVYDVKAIVNLPGDTINSPGHENERVIEVKTVEKIFSDTVDNPIVSGNDYYDTYWTGFATSGNTAGWHKVDRGYLSRESYYVGKTTTWSYVGSMDAELISDPINLEGVTGATLRWYTQFHVEGGAYDNMMLYFSADNGSSWQRVTRYPEDNYRNSSQYPDSDNGWIMKEKVLENMYYTSEFRIKYRFVTDRAINYMGAFIDDISVYVTSSDQNHKPVARFKADWVDDDIIKGTAYSKTLVQRPEPEFDEIRGNTAYMNLPNPEGGDQGGVGFSKTEKKSDTIKFDASYSYDPDRIDEDMTFIWDFGDGETGNGVTVEHEYTEVPSEKFYQVILTVKDDRDDLLVSTDYLYVWLGNAPPIVRFNITNAFDIHTRINNDFGAEVYYGDELFLVQDVRDPEGDTIESFDWTFEVKTPGWDLTTTTDGDTVEFTVGKDHLYYDTEKDENKVDQPVMPPFGSNPVEYVITLVAEDDNGNQGSYSLNVTVYPYATAEFKSVVRLGQTLLEATVNLVYRGKPEDAAESSTLITPEHPVYVHINEVTSPDPNLENRGGIGKVFEIETVGCRLQNNEEGFIQAEIRIPILTSDLDAIGDSNALEDDVKLEVYDEKQKRFFVVDNSIVETEKSVKYVTGTVDHFSIFTAIVDSIYNTSNDKYYDVLPDLSVTKIQFSRAPAQNGQEVEVRAYIKNSGKINAQNVDVKLYDGDDLIGDQRIDVVKAGGTVVVVKEIFTVSMIDPTQQFENHYIKVFVNKQRAINEGPQNYNNNDNQELLVVTTMQTTTPSFGATSMMMVMSAAMVVGGSMAVLRTSRKKRE